MPRTRRTLQFDFDPGESGELPGPFVDPETNDEVTVYVRVPGCGDEDATESGRRFNRQMRRWEITLPPDVTEDFDGLVGTDGVALTLTIAAGRCPETETSSPAGEEPPLHGSRPDLEADVVPDPPIFDERADVMAEEMDLPE